jgi:hypothetical protein
MLQTIVNKPNKHLILLHHKQVGKVFGRFGAKGRSLVERLFIKFTHKKTRHVLKRDGFPHYYQKSYFAFEYLLATSAQFITLKKASI